MSTILEMVSKKCRSGAIYVGTALQAPSSRQVQGVLLLVGLLLLSGGMLEHAQAYTQQAKYNDDRIAESVDLILTYVNGTFGALIMVSAGIAAIMASAFGQYKAALGLLVVAVGSFILRSLISTWFNDENLQSK